MEVTEDVIIEATGLEMEGINFSGDKKVSNRVVDIFTELD